MKIATNGIVTDQYGQVLLIERSDRRVWALPGGGLEVGETPLEGAAREVQEETGIRVHPVRLIGLYYWPCPPDGLLILAFRCLQSGGGLQSSAESLQVGYWPTQQLPTPMETIHRERIEHSLTHLDERPLWNVQAPTLNHKLKLWYWRNGGYRLAAWRGSKTAVSSSPNWRAGAFTIIRNENGQVLWVKRTDNGQWNLPGGGRKPLEAVWQTAVRETYEETGLRVTLTHLSGTYQFSDDAELKFVFTAEITGGTLTTGTEAAEFGWFAPGEEPENVYAPHLERAADAAGDIKQTVFKIQASSGS